MATFLSVQSEVKEAMKSFEELEKYTPKIQRSLLAGIGSRVKTIIKKDYMRHLKINTGNLYQDIKRMVVKRGNAVVITTTARGQNNAFYGHAQAQGSTIRSKTSGGLIFKIDDKWIRKHEVKLPERDWFEQPASSYIGSPAYHKQIEKLVDREIKKLEKKGIIESENRITGA
jgi:hypothetical protein